MTVPLWLLVSRQLATPFIDEKGDIYFYCVAMFGYQPGVKEGFLRIKKGQTDFDKSYCFTLADVDLVGCQR